MKNRTSYCRLLKVIMGIILITMSLAAYAATKVSGKDLSATGTSLDDFEFEIEGNTIKLEEYKGTDYEVTIEASYELNGKTYKTDLSRFMFGLFNKYPTRAYISEGIEEIYNPIFNSCDVNEIYLPKSLKSLNPKVLSYFPHYDSMFNPVVSKIFYPGTQEEFVQLLIKGSGMTAKEAEGVNLFAGFGFDASSLEFIFEATREDYESGIF